MGNVEGQREYIEAIIISMESLRYQKISVMRTFRLAIGNLYSYYEASGDRGYLEVALCHIQAYLEMGFVYEDEEEIFTRVLLALGTDRATEFPKRFYNSRKITLNKARVRQMIGRWTPSQYRTAPINEVVDDIMDKVSGHKNGVHQYYCQTSTNKKRDEYELVINDEECFFHDISRKIYYTFQLPDCK